MTIIFTLLGAFCNALNVTAQHVASIGSPKQAGWRFVISLLKHPLWLLGWAALAGGFVFQALALHAGQMSVVQPLLLTELIFALGLRHAWLRQSIRRVTWSAAAVTCLSLGVFLATAEPEGGSPYPASHVWAGAAGTTVGAAALLALLAVRATPARRTALLAVASGIMWALVATLVKTMTDTWSQFGVAGMFGHWPVYALAAAGLATEVVHQATLRAGPLSISQPLFVIVDPIVSIGLSVWIFGEYFTASAPRLALG
ncbi:MAG: DMT family transporter [Actinobacteria bacterium]|nr:DMT family transporter [Actinomycetota bacterium]